MNGARKFAFDQIVPHITPPCRVLDVGAGDGWLSVALREKGCDVMLLDMNPDRIPHGVQLVIGDWARPIGGKYLNLLGRFDVVCAVYTLQHLLDDETVGWWNVRRVLKPDGRAFVVGRYRHDQGREYDRADPLNGYNQHGITALVHAAGLTVRSLHVGEYLEHGWVDIAHTEQPNSFCAELTRWT